MAQFVFCTEQTELNRNGFTTATSGLRYIIYNENLLPCHLLARFYQGTKAQATLKNNTEVQVPCRQVAQRSKQKFKSQVAVNCKHMVSVY